MEKGKVISAESIVGAVAIYRTAIGAARRAKAGLIRESGSSLGEAKCMERMQVPLDKKRLGQGSLGIIDSRQGDLAILHTSAHNK